MGKFDANKCKTNLKLAIQRMKLQANKKTNLNARAEHEIADLLRKEKTELARIKVEAIIREDLLIQAFEIMELFIELLHSRIAMIKMQKTVPYDLKEAICTVIYAAARIEIKELHEVRKQLVNKYGEGICNDAMENRGNCVNPKIIHKLSVIAPENYLVFEYLGNIAKKHNVDWCSPYQGDSCLIDNSPSAPNSLNQPIQPTNFAPSPFSPQNNVQYNNNNNNNFVPQQQQQSGFVPPQGSQPVLPGAGYGSGGNQPNNSFGFPSVPSSGGNSQGPPPYSPQNNNGGGGGLNFPSTPSSGGNSNSFDFPSTPNNQNANSNAPMDFPTIPGSGNSNSGDDFDDLTARFNRLKKK